MSLGGRPSLTWRMVAVFAILAVFAPTLSLLVYMILAAQLGADAEVQAYQFQACRRGQCLDNGGSTTGNSELETLGSVILYPYIIGAVGWLVALLTRRRGWITVPLTLLHVLMSLTLWNALFYWATDGNRVLGPVLLITVAAGVPIAMALLGTLAVPRAAKKRANSIPG